MPGARCKAAFCGKMYACESIFRPSSYPKASRGKNIRTGVVLANAGGNWDRRCPQPGRAVVRRKRSHCIPPRRVGLGISGRLHCCRIGGAGGVDHPPSRVALLVASFGSHRAVLLDYVYPNIHVGDADQLERAVPGGASLPVGGGFLHRWLVVTGWAGIARKPGLGVGGQCRLRAGSLRGVAQHSERDAPSFADA